MGDSFGKYGVDLTVFGPYQMPSLSYQYGIDDSTGRFDQGDINDGACPEGPPCSLDVRLDAISAWRRDVGNDTVNAYEIIFILSAGQDESSTWQEFGEMKFASKDEIPDSFGAPGNSSVPNWAHTRYVDWTSWASASNLWPTAGNGSIVAAESSGMGNFAHELSHLIGIRDNYNNPFSVPPRRDYTGPYSMLSRGEFNGPGGPHSRWQIPPVQGGAMGSLHTMRDKHQLGLIDAASILQISRSELAASGPVIAEVLARSVDPAGGLMGFNISFDSAGDLSPYCNISLDALCDGGLYDNYNIEVVDRMGADSFCPDSGVMITKTKNSDVAQPFQWVIDANPQDAHEVDFYLPNGTARYWTIGDYRQLVDALFHAGTNSGSEYEHVDEANGLHLYILDVRRDQGVLKYTVSVRSTSTNATSPATYGVALSDGTYADSYCAFELTNTGMASAGNTTSAYPQDLSTYVGSDIYRVSAEVDSVGWKVGVPNALAHAKFGECAEVKVAVGRVTNGTDYQTSDATVQVKVVSESDGSVVATATCRV
jgi:M6 family metalloprotease-like protein